ncbi:MAG: hypothetical protein PHE50_02590, partial [Dehalococcoidales bacterium]|nr:hypothetical protein [Dehalococcoidales bacterium]
MANRTKGEGSLSHKPNGTWLAQISVEGKRINKVRPTKREAQDWLNSMKTQVKQGLTYASSKTKVEDIFPEWLQMKEASRRPATGAQYAMTGRLYILPHLGSLKMQDLSAAKIQNFYNKLLGEGIGKRTIEITHTVLHGFLEYSLKHGLVAQNWAALAEVPRPETREMSIWDEGQVSQFILSVGGDPFYRLALATGMRQGELMGLQWKDIDFQTGKLNVRRQVYEPSGGGF